VQILFVTPLIYISDMYMKDVTRYRDKQEGNKVEVMAKKS